MLSYFTDNFYDIKEWCSTLIDEETDIIQPSARIKIIKTPRKTSYGLPEVLNKSWIRGLALFELLPGCYVYPHKHEDSSYTYIEDGEMIHVPWDGVEYKTTHVVLETNPEAYFMMEDVKHKWTQNVVEELDVIHQTHWAENPGITSIRFLYVDYYDS